MRPLSGLLALLLPLSSFAAECGFGTACVRDERLCREAASLEHDAEALTAARAAKTRGVAEEDVAPLNARYRRVLERAKSDIHDERETLPALEPAIDCLRGKINQLTIGVLPMTLEALNDTVGALEKRLDAFGKKVDAAGCSKDCSLALFEELDALDAEGSRAWHHAHVASLNLDDMSPWARDYETLDDGTQRERVSPSEGGRPYVNSVLERLGALSEKLQAVAKKLGRSGSSPEQREAGLKREQAIAKFKDPFAHGGGADAGGGGAVSSKPSHSRVGADTLALAAGSPTLLDLKHVPPAPATKAPPPPQSFLPNWFERNILKKHDVTADRDELERIMDLRDAGKTTTVGDPGGRASLNFRQRGDTCAIASQIVVMKDAGAVPRDADPHKLEDELYLKAARLGYIDGADSDPSRRYHTSTDGRYIGQLLPMPVVKKIRAQPAELDAAVMRGKILIVSTNSSILWNQPDIRGGHVVTVTGAEVEPKTGRVLGYYINDTGKGQGGRLVPAEQFLRAWQANASVIVEPQ